MEKIYSNKYSYQNKNIVSKKKTIQHNFDLSTFNQNATKKILSYLCFPEGRRNYYRYRFNQISRLKKEFLI